MNHLFLVIAVFIISCIQSKKEIGIIEGQVLLRDSNCMPSPGAHPCPEEEVECIVILSKETEDYNPDLVFKQYKTDSLGKFKIEAITGAYSLFINYNDEISCSWQECSPDCICSPIKVEKDSTVKVKLIIDQANY